MERPGRVTRTVLSPPQALTENHRTDTFDCGEPILNDWLRRRALGNQHASASRSFVVVDEHSAVCAYYCLAAGAITHDQATGAIRRNMPDPIPVMVLGRLAVDRCHQGHHLGAALLKDAVQRAVKVSEQLGVRALLVHALNETAQQFYRHYGFQSSPIHSMTLTLRIRNEALRRP